MVILWRRVERSCAEAKEGFDHERCTEFGEAGGKLRRGFGWADRELVTEEHCAGVHTGVNAHGGDSGDGFAVGNGPLDGSGPAIFGEQRGVGVDPAEFGNVEQASGDDLAVSDDDDGVGIGFAEELFGFGGANFFGLQDGDVSGESGFFYWREGNFLAAAPWAVGLSDYCGDLQVRLGEDVLEGGDGKGWGTAEE